MKQPPKPRRVWVDELPWGFMVLYCDRKKYQRRSPAQFDRREMTREQVRQWVLDRPELFTLVDDPYSEDKPE